MNRSVIAGLGALALLPSIAQAHRLDEYLQATLVEVGRDRLVASMRLVAGEAVSGSVTAMIDRDGDGRFSAREQQAYAARVVADLAVSVDGRPVRPRLESWRFPAPADMRSGLAEIHIRYSAPAPQASGAHTLVIENRHRADDSAYLVNALAPRDRQLCIEAQKRDARQARYQLDWRWEMPAAGPALTRCSRDRQQPSPVVGGPPGRSGQAARRTGHPGPPQNSSSPPSGS